MNETEFRNRHSIQLSTPVNGHGYFPQVMLQEEGRKARCVYDSHDEHGNAGIFKDRGEAMAHGERWIE